MTNTFTQQFQDGSALTEAQLISAFTSVKPSLSNLSLSTTGSSAFQVLRSTGSAATPEYDDIGDILASGTMTAAGANKVIEAVDSSVSSAAANILRNVTTRTTGSAVGVGGIGISNRINDTITTDTAFGGSSVTITTTGRPVVVELFPSPAFPSSNSYIGISGETTAISVAIELYRDTTLVGSHLVRMFAAQNGGSPSLIASLTPSGSIRFLDTPVAGTYTYSLQGDSASEGITISNSVLVVREI